MGKGSLKKSKIFKTKIFGIFIACAVVLIVIFLDQNSIIFKSLEYKILDLQFRSKKTNFFKNKDSEDAQIKDPNPNISRDIVIVGIDNETLFHYGRWPFARSIHADLVNSFSRVQDQSTRENALLLDIFFIENSENPEDDAILAKAIKDNGKVFLETILVNKDKNFEENWKRHEAIISKIGEITNVQGATSKLDTFYGSTPPLFSYGQASSGYGHANFSPDRDEIYRHQRLIARLSKEIDQIYLSDLDLNYTFNPEKLQRLVWFDKDLQGHDIQLNDLSKNELVKLKKEIKTNGLSKTINSDNSDSNQKVYILRKYQDHYVPSITLALALRYFHRKPSDIEVYIGNKIVINNPLVYNTKEGKLVPYKIKGEILDKIEIPIDNNGQMLVNYMGPPSSTSTSGYQTYQTKPYLSLAENAPGPDKTTWDIRRSTVIGDNKIFMVGAFSKGMADDEKNTPFGLMYGIEIHANALNTIIMNNSIKQLSSLTNYILLILIVLFVAFITSRIPTGWALLITFVAEIGLFFIPNFIFEWSNIAFENGKPMVTVLLTFIVIVVYRVFIEERDKRRVQGMFGKYVSPVVVEKMLDSPPQLGGVDAEMTVFFSDIRGFTSLSETMTPQDLVALLNEYLTSMTDCLMDFDGTLDKYIGDAIMGFWGAPLSQKDHAILACRCAVRQLELLTELNKNWPDNKQIDIGIGLNSGICTVGNMGSAGRMNYTVMGDNVNLASRLESINKQYKTRIIISEKTYEKVKNENFIVRELDNIRVKGKLEPVKIYELVGIDD